MNAQVLTPPTPPKNKKKSHKQSYQAQQNMILSIYFRFYLTDLMQK